MFVSGGQSNANFNKKAFGVGIENVVTQSTVFSNAEVVKTAMGGTPLIKWMDDDGNPQKFYHSIFFNHSGEGKPGQLEQRIQEIKERGDIVRFRGFFWFQGEAELKPEKGGSVEKYQKRFDLLLNQLAKDIGHEDWNFVMNTVSKKKVAGASKGINDVLADIAKTNPREFFTTPRKAHKEQVAACIHTITFSWVRITPGCLSNLSWPIKLSQRRNRYGKPLSRIDLE